MKYIDSEKLITEIDSRMESCAYEGTTPNQKEWETLLSIKKFVTALPQEQPKVDLEKEIEKWFDMIGDPWEDGEWSTNDIRSAARHFYELGLNARKEE